MRNEVNVINLSNQIPLSFSIIECDFILPHMHSTTQILIVIKGELELTLEDSTYLMKKNDIIIINPRQVHKVDSVNRSLLLSVFLDVHGFLDEGDTSNIIFQLNSVENPNLERYDTIRYLIYSIIRLNSRDNVNSIHNTKAIVYSLFSQLMNEFKVELPNDRKDLKQYDTITLITTYINDYYKKHLTLSDISKHFNYTISYLSKLFKNKLNTTFIDYYDNLRINYSLDQLLLTNSSIEEIAVNNGFENSRSYVRAFQNIFKCYPSLYRKQHKKGNANYSLDQNALQKEAIDIIMEDYLSYIKVNNIDETIKNTKEVIELDGMEAGSPFHNSMKTVLCLGSIQTIYLEMIQNELLQIQSEVGYSYLLLDDLFSDSLHFFTKDETNVFINPSVLMYLQYVLKKLHIAPFFVLEYDDENQEFQEMEQYAYALLDQFKNFSKENKCEPILFSICHKTKNLKKEIAIDFYNSVINLYEKLKVDFTLRLASPKITSTLELNFCLQFRKNGSVIQYLWLDYVALQNTETIIKEKNRYKDFIDSLNIEPRKLIVSNLNFTGEKLNLLHDTIYMSCFICRNAIRTIDQTFATIPNPMFDIAISEPFQINPFDGYSGFYTYNFIRKASYYANLFCAKLGNKILKKGKHYIITANQDKIIILLNNYSHYSDLYADSKYYEIRNENRYECFSKSTKICYNLQISKLNYSSVKIKTYFISKKSGSSYDKYMEMCINSLLDLDEFKRFKHMCELNFKVETKPIYNKHLTIETTLDPLESQLIELSLK